MEDEGETRAIGEGETMEGDGGRRGRVEGKKEMRSGRINSSVDRRGRGEEKEGG